MTHALNAPNLSNSFLELQLLTEDHKEELRLLANEESIWTWMVAPGFGPHFDGYWHKMMGLNASGDIISFAVFDRSTDQFVGHSSFLMIDPHNQRVEIGHTWYGKNARGSYVNPACKRLMLERGFDWGAVRMELKTHSKNARSRAAMLKMGATEEGTLRSHTKLSDGTWRDTVYFSVLKSEWPQVRDSLDARLLAFPGSGG